MTMHMRYSGNDRAACGTRLTVGADSVRTDAEPEDLDLVDCRREACGPEARRRAAKERKRRKRLATDRIEVLGRVIRVHDEGFVSLERWHQGGLDAEALRGLADALREAAICLDVKERESSEHGYTRREIAILMDGIGERPQ